MQEGRISTINEVEKRSTMAELFGVQIPAISTHLKNIFTDGELDEKVVISKIAITT